MRERRPNEGRHGMQRNTGPAPCPDYISYRHDRPFGSERTPRRRPPYSPSLPGQPQHPPTGRHHAIILQAYLHLRLHLGPADPGGRPVPDGPVLRLGAADRSGKRQAAVAAARQRPCAERGHAARARADPGCEPPRFAVRAAGRHAVEPAGNGLGVPAGITQQRDCPHHG